VDADTLASMRADSDIEAFSAAEVLGYAEVTVNNSNKPYLYVEAIDSGFSDRMPVHLVEGRMPENGTELLIPDHLQAYSDAGTYLVGDTLTLELGDRYSGGWRLWQNNGFQPEGDESADPGLTDEPEQPEQQAAAWREPVQMQAVREPGGPAEAVPDAAILWSGRCGSLHLHIQVR